MNRDAVALRLTELVLSLVILALLITACAATPVSHGCDGPARDHVMLVDRLRCAGLRVDIGESVRLPPLRGSGTALLVTGAGVSGEARIESFSYDDTDLGTDARAVVRDDAAKFAPDGSLRDPAPPSRTTAHPTSSAQIA